jgi:GNAT superfamily N-acetyltransferase
MREEVGFTGVNTPGGFSRVAELAERIWRQHYTPIIGGEQVDYMLEHFQSPNAIEDQVSEGVSYYLIQKSGEDAGYLAFDKRGAFLFLSKIYLLESERGKGFGKSAMAFVAEKARELKCKGISLTVNKYNDRSIKAYKQMGFTIEGDQVFDIGGGFVMDDYQMVKIL